MKDVISEEIMIAGGQFDKEKEYWLNKLSGERTVSRFPFDLVPPPFPGNKMERLAFRFPGDIYNRLIRLSGRSEFGIFVILTAGISYLLAKYTGNEDIIIGTPVFKQEVPGEYFNTFLALRNRIVGEMTFKDLLLQAKRTVTEANDHMNFPLERICRLLGLRGEDNVFQLFNTLVIFDNIQDTVFPGENNDHMCFAFHNTGRYIEGEVTYNSTLYSNGFVGVLVGHLVNFYEIATGAPGSKLSGIDVLSDEEKRRLLVDFNNTRGDYPKDKTIHQLFEDQVEKSLDVLAISFEDRQFTFRQLNETSNRVAGMLAAKGIREGHIGALMVKRSQEMVVGYLGVLKANAAVLPVDFYCPPKRRDTILADSGAGFVLKQKEQGYPGDFPGIVVDIDADERDEYGAANPGLPAAPNSLAIVIYTSGSTGKPKGVMLHHRGVNNHSFTKIKIVGLGLEDLCCHNLNIGFVASIWQIFAPLLMGAKLYIYPRAVIMDAYEFFKQVRKHRVTVLEVVPSFLNAYLKLVKAGRQKVDLNTIRTLLLTGEKVEPSLVNMFYENYRIDLVNAYGQSECSDDTLHYNIPYNTGTVLVPLGSPSDNTCVYVLDKDNQPQPVGVPGELYIRGDGLAIGYLNRPELTREKFTVNPFLPKGRMFKTGDFTRWLPGGDIEFLGRVDYQVKIRGHRIELGEIENRLSAYEGIKESVVIPRENKKGNKYLCAYFVSEIPLSSPRLREYLLTELPEYMVPLYFVSMEKIPLNPNGKIDRKSLPMPELAGAREGYVAPRGKLEQIIGDIFREFYGIDKVGIHDNFFDLGATSLELLQVNGKLQKILEREIPLVLFFEYPTIAALVGHLQLNESAEASSPEDAGLDDLMDSGKNKLRQLRKRMHAEGSPG